MNRSICLARACRAHASGRRLLQPARSRRGRSRQGFTLIEMLVSLAITLLMMGAVVTLFGVISDSIAASRSLIEISDRLRGARETLQQDLQGVTASLTPPLRPENNQGYFEISEGPMNDGSAQFNGLNALFGDIDDFLMFTTSRPDAPFIGRAQVGGGSPVTIESPNAEVIYFVVQDGPIIDATSTPPTQLCSLYRRVQLVAPQVGNLPVTGNSYFSANDVSSRFETISGNDFMVPNTLGDLTKRENRFAHYAVGTYKDFPFLVNTDRLPWIETAPPPAHFGALRPVNQPGGAAFASHPTENAFLMPFDVSTPRFGDDRLLTNVLAFDVQVFDPDAPVVANAGLVVPTNTPTSTEYTSRVGSPISLGDYVDLGYVTAAGITTLPLGGLMDNRSGNAGSRFMYDTWSDHYENDGVDQHGDGDIDLATNGLDDTTVSGAANGLVDDVSERETMPPYPVPLRGIRVTIRVYETSSKQVREAVVLQNFDAK